MPSSPVGDFFQSRSARSAEKLAEEWSASIDPTEGVGSKHHIVPKFYLERFADNSHRVKVRDRGENPVRNQHPKEFAIRDYYTVLDKDGQLDGSYEQIFAQIEDSASRVLRDINSPYSNGIFDYRSKEVVTTFVAFQMVRGQRRRRQFELLADLHVKLMVPDSELDQLKGLIAVPHPNDHMKSIGPTSEAIFRELMGWTPFLVDIDHMGFITCDEPVLVYHENKPSPAHLESCGSVNGHAQISGKVVHISGGPSIANADSIVLPLDPRTCLFFRRDDVASRKRISASGAEALEVAEEVRSMAISSAYMYAYSHPGQVYLDSISLPDIQPFYEVCGVDPIRAEVSTSVPKKLRPAMLRDRTEHKKSK